LQYGSNKKIRDSGGAAMDDVDIDHSQTSQERRYLLDPYVDWTKGEGIPIADDFGHDILTIETGPWARYDARGAFLHVKGRGDFISAYALELPPGKKTAPQRHLFEEVVYVLEGNGSTTIDVPGGGQHTFEWGPRSLFALPLNVTYRHFNGSGQHKALLACTHNMPLVMNTFHNADFLFNNPFEFPERLGDAKYFNGEGDFTAIKPGRHMWETNFVPDLSKMKLHTWDARGAGSANICFILADGVMHAHTSEIPAARYKKAHRHDMGVHIYAVTGSGYTLLWNEGDEDFKRVPWRHGTMYAPPFWMFHQHFNTAPQPARYLAIAIGSRRYPFTTMRRVGAAGAVDTSVKKGGRQIEYEDQDPRIHATWLKELAAVGGKSDMGTYFPEDEKALAK
jgi:mannose-6-phosphate isomerase-like protein (cupin superfamily)